MTYPATYKSGDGRYETAGAYLLGEKGLSVDKTKDVAEASKRYDKMVQWAAFADKYFLTGILADKTPGGVDTA